MAERPAPSELWKQACEEVPITSGERSQGVMLSERRSGRFRELMREHGHLIPGEPKPLPCGWQPSASADPVAVSP